MQRSRVAKILLNKKIRRFALSESGQCNISANFKNYEAKQLRNQFTLFVKGSENEQYKKAVFSINRSRKLSIHMKRNQTHSIYKNQFQMDSRNAEIAPIRPTLPWIIIINLGQCIKKLLSERLKEIQMQTETPRDTLGKGYSTEFPIFNFACKISCMCTTVARSKNAYSSQYTWLKTRNRRV